MNQRLQQITLQGAHNFISFPPIYFRTMGCMTSKPDSFGRLSDKVDQLSNRLSGLVDELKRQNELHGDNALDRQHSGGNHHTDSGSQNAPRSSNHKHRRETTPLHCTPSTESTDRIAGPHINHGGQATSPVQRAAVPPASPRAIPRAVPRPDSPRPKLSDPRVDQIRPKNCRRQGTAYRAAAEPQTDRPDMAAVPLPLSFKSRIPLKPPPR